MSQYTGIVTWSGGRMKAYTKGFRSQLDGIFKRSGAICMSIYQGQSHIETVWKEDKLKWYKQ